MPLFTNCARCGAPWPLKSRSYQNTPTDGENFCSHCTLPAPWLTRAQRIAWIGHQLQADSSLSPETRDELLAVVERLQGLEPGNDKAIRGWEAIRSRAPKVWETIKPVLQTVAGEALKGKLGL